MQTSTIKFDNTYRLQSMVDEKKLFDNRVMLRMVEFLDRFFPVIWFSFETFKETLIINMNSHIYFNEQYMIRLVHMGFLETELYQKDRPEFDVIRPEQIRLYRVKDMSPELKRELILDRLLNDEINTIPSEKYIEYKMADIFIERELD